MVSLMFLLLKIVENNVYQVLTIYFIYIKFIVMFSTLLSWFVFLYIVDVVNYTLIKIEEKKS